MNNVSNNSPFVKPNLVNYKLHTPISSWFQNGLRKTMFFNTRNINITVTSLVSIRVDWRRDDTVDKKRENSSVPKHLFNFFLVVELPPWRKVKIRLTALKILSATRY